MRITVSQLYHAPVALEISRFGLLALVPPGSEARKLALLKRSLFAAAGEASGLALPELAALAFGPRDLGLPAAKAGRRKALAALERGLSEAGSLAKGGFETGRVVEAEGTFYLELLGPFEELKEAALAAARAALPAASWAERPSSCPFSLAALPGLLVAAPSGPEAAGRVRDFLGSAPLPRLSFRDARLSLFRLSARALPLALAWRELADAKRRTGL